MLKDAKLMDVKLNKGNNRYFLTLTYQGKDDKGNIHEKIFKHVPLPLYSYPRDISFYLSTNYTQNVTDMDFGFGSISLFPNTFEVTDRIVEYATKEMTLEEIEKKLGHKIKIVTEKEK